ncbi:MAG: response regulator [Desulfobacula sp.]|uniref:ATP-binding protein n=1 Tax=Desulfobacula sp. TaxID=2593537 RepID=UPI001D81C264|nr:response regulator [Desulfobacula sp.]MBT3484144.1 response regulator [Desulfobacula sp.]MBT3803743.1 response regulator [Desulfobacula sp.]MBT4024448.1 response regulator [Desulfobacula sp.]MBT4198489.1 response regulator [Desulfobacula sp.]
MMDLFDDIMDSTGIEAKYPLLHLLEKKLPQCIIEIISQNGQRICSNPKSFVNGVFEKVLWEKTKKSDNLIYSENIKNSFICAWYFENIQCLVVGSFLEIPDPFSTKKIISNVVTLCVEIFHKDQLLAEEKERLLIHKKQRDRKIKVLEKKYEDILIKNEEQSAEYSKLLRSEIQRQTAELKKSNKSLKLAKKKAEAANLSKDRFLANMSHEIRTPMNSILGFLELILEDPSIKNDHRQQLSIALSSAQGLLSMINDILDVSKLQVGKIVLEKKPFKLLELIKKTFDTMNISAQKKGLTLEYDIHSSVSKTFLGDAFRIKQIIINLIGNAIKFTEQGGVFLKILPGEQKKKIHFMVKDTGVGIPPDRLIKIFDPFEQTDMSTTRKYGGTGLGTTISKQFVDLMGGQIWAESEQGKGSIFHFIINIEPTDDKSIEDIDVLNETKKSEQRFDRVFKILLAEDTDSSAILVKTRLERQGHIITRVCNGREAVDTLKKELFDIILMDVHMPEMGGLEATEIIRSTKNVTAQQIPIIALTASVMGDEIKRFIAAGMNSVVAKPIEFKKLNSIMNKLVPKNQGLKKSEKNIPNTTCDNSETPKIKGVDYEAGIARWQDQEIYKTSLIEFANQYTNFFNTLSFWIDTDEMERAYLATHSLKGVAGNLSINKVTDIAATINLALKKKDLKTAREQSVFLEAELRSTILSILELETMHKTDIHLKKRDPERISLLIKKIMDVFDQFTPHDLKPLMEELETYIHIDQLRPIMKNSEDLDFDSAKKQLMKLVESLNLK